MVYGDEASRIVTTYDPQTSAKTSLKPPYLTQFERHFIKHA